jgi:hypothetical protein
MITNRDKLIELLEDIGIDDVYSIMQFVYTKDINNVMEGRYIPRIKCGDKVVFNRAYALLPKLTLGTVSEVVDKYTLRINIEGKLMTIPTEYVDKII